DAVEAKCVAHFAGLNRAGGGAVVGDCAGAVEDGAERLGVEAPPVRETSGRGDALALARATGQPERLNLRPAQRAAEKLDLVNLAVERRAEVAILANPQIAGVNEASDGGDARVENLRAVDIKPQLLRDPIHDRGDMIPLAVVEQRAGRGIIHAVELETQI